MAAVIKRESRLSMAPSLGPDALMELLVCHLYRLGASQAEQVLFVADGALWIWDRIPMVVHKAGLKNWNVCVDFCHVMSHVSAAINSVEQWDKAYRKKRRTELKRLILDSRLDEALSDLKEMNKSHKRKEISGAIGYLEARRKLVDYSSLRSKGLPIGSGVVEVLFVE